MQLYGKYLHALCLLWSLLVYGFSFSVLVTLYVTYTCTVYTGHKPEVTHYGVVWWGHNGGSKDKGEGDWIKHGSHRDQSEPSSTTKQANNIVSTL